MNVNAYPLPGRTDMLSYLKTHQANIPDDPIVRNAACCLDEFRAESGDQVKSDILEAMSKASRLQTGGIIAGGLLGLAGLATGYGLVGALAGIGVAGASIYLANKRAESLQDFGLWIGVCNMSQVIDGKFDQPQAKQAPPVQPQSQSQTFVEAEPMPSGWKKTSAPKTDVVIDMVYDPTRGTHVAHTIHEFERPPAAPEPKTVTVIDMKPNAQGAFEMSGIRDYRV